MAPSTWLEQASLSKTIGTAFALEYFAARGVPLDTPVNDLLARAGSPLRLGAAPGKPAAWADALKLHHLMDHSGLGLHYVNGIALDDPRPIPPVLALVAGGPRAREHGYPAEGLRVEKEPGTRFGYSGGGFLVLQHLLETLEGGAPIAEVTRPFLDACGMREFSFAQRAPALPEGAQHVATGFKDDGTPVRGTRLMFPPFAAGGLGSPRALAAFLRVLADAYAGKRGLPISPATARAMLDAGGARRGNERADLGSFEFMRARMGLGTFVANAGPNRLMLHQAANDGFRGLYLVCFEGPDAGKGLVVLCNGDNKGMFVNCEATKLLLAPLLRHGVDWARVDGKIAQFEAALAGGMRQEEIVNLGLRDIVFAAFDDDASPVPGRARL